MMCDRGYDDFAVGKPISDGVREPGKNVAPRAAPDRPPFWRPHDEIDCALHVDGELGAEPVASFLVPEDTVAEIGGRATLETVGLPTV
jgi:hypothetical protein